jgi:DNA repair protein RadA/Sms
VRAVGHGESRLKEAAKLGFSRAIIPRSGKDWTVSLEVQELSRLNDLIGVMGGQCPRDRTRVIER